MPHTPRHGKDNQKTYISSKVLWVKGAPATSSCTGGGTHLSRCELTMMMMKKVIMTMMMIIALLS